MKIRMVACLCLVVTLACLSWAMNESQFTTASSRRALVHQGRSLDRWLAQLHHPEAEPRRQAVRAVREMGAPARAALPALQGALHDPDLAVRRETALALRELGPVALSTLCDSLREQEESVRSLLVWALGEVACAPEVTPAQMQKAVRALLPVLHDREKVIRGGCETALIKFGQGKQGQVVAVELGQALLNETTAHREQLGRLLEAIGPPARHAVPTVLATAREGQPAWKEQAMRLLGSLTGSLEGESLRTSVTWLLAELDAEPIAVREEALLALTRLAGARQADAWGKRAVPHLLPLLENKAMRAQAARALGRLGEIALPELLATLRDRKHQPPVRLAAAEALGLAGKSAFADLLKAASEEDPLTRQGAAHALGVMANRLDPASARRALAPLLKACKAEEDAVRRVSLVALGRLAAEPDLLRAEELKPVFATFPRALEDAPCCNDAIAVLEHLGGKRTFSTELTQSTVLALEHHAATPEGRVARRALVRLAPTTEPALAFWARMGNADYRDNPLAALDAEDFAPRVLAQHGAALVPPLCALLQCADPAARDRYLALLTALGNDARPAIPCLLALREEARITQAERVRILQILDGVGLDDAQIIPLLTAELGARWSPPGVTRKPHARLPYNWVLSEQLKRRGVRAVPALLARLEAEQQEVVDHATEILRQIGEPALPALLEAIRAGKPALRDRCVEVLAYPGFTEPMRTRVVTALVQGLQAPQVAVRTACVRALRKHRVAPSTLEAVARLLDDADESVRLEAIRTLRESALPGSLAMLRGLQGREGEVRLACLLELAVEEQPCSPVIARAVAAVLFDHDATLREQAVKILRRHGSQAVDAIPQLIKVLQEGDAGQKADAARVLAALGRRAAPARHALEKAAGHREPEVRRWAALAVHRAGGKVSLAQILEVYESPTLRPLALRPLVEVLRRPESQEDDVRRVARRLASDAATDKAGPALLQALADLCHFRSVPREDLGATADLLLRQGAGPNALTRLISVLHDSEASFEDKRRAAQGLAQRGAEARPALPALRQLVLALDTEGSKQPYLDALQAIGRPAVPVLLETLWSSRDYATRSGATMALAHLGAEARSAVAALGRELTSDVGVHAATALGAIGPDASPTLPALLALWLKVDREGQDAILPAVARIGPATLQVLEPILEELCAPDFPGDRDSRYEQILDLLGYLAGLEEPGMREVGPLATLPGRTPNEGVRERIATLLAAMLPDDEHPHDCGALAAAFLLKLGPCGAPAVQRLGEALEDTRKREVVLRYLEALGRIGPEAVPTVPAILHVLQRSEHSHDGEDVVEVAIETLGRIGPEARAATFPLLLLVQHGTPAQQMAATRALGRLGAVAQPAVPALRTCLEDGDAAQRLLRAEALWRIDHDARRVTPVLLELLHEERLIPQRHSRWDAESRWTIGQRAARLLVQIGAGEKTVAGQLQPLLHHGCAHTRANAHLALWHLTPGHEPPVEVVTDVIQSGTVAEMRRAGLALMRRGSSAKTALPALVEQLCQTDEERVRAAAAVLRGLQLQEAAATMVLERIARGPWQWMLGARTPERWKQGEIIHGRFVSRAVRALRHLGPTIAGRILPALEKEYLPTALAILGTLAADGENSAEQRQEILVSLLDLLDRKESPETRRDVVTALGQLAGHPHLGSELSRKVQHTLLDQLQARDFTLALHTAQVVGRCAEPMLPVLREQLQKGTPLERRRAALALGFCEPASLGQPEGKSIRTLAHALLHALDDPLPEVRLEGARALGRLGPALLQGEDTLLSAKLLPRLLGLLDDSAGQVRWEAATALTCLGSVPVPGLLARLADQENPRRASAITVLRDLGTRSWEAIPALIGLLSQEDELGDRASECLAHIGPRALPALLRALNTGDPEVRQRAASALGEMGQLPQWSSSRRTNKEAASALGQALSDPDPRVRFAAARALARAPQLARGARPALKAALKRDEEIIRVLAREALRTAEP